MKLESKIDASVNFTEEKLAGFLESRYVRKVPDYFICYLSSHNGCSMGCKMCHLTVTGQTMMRPSTRLELWDQADRVFEHYRSQPKAKVVHFNFMARGEPLLNEEVTSPDQYALIGLGKMARQNWHDLSVKFNISTIMPKGTPDLVRAFPIITPTIYYSIYSVQEMFRYHWLPNALPVDEAVRQLKDYQAFSKKIVKLHYAFIKDENDAGLDVDDICDAVLKHQLLCEFNLVRYNPSTPLQGVEASEERLQLLLKRFQRRLQGKVQMIPRVGFDVAASCGMFVSKED